MPRKRRITGHRKILKRPAANTPGGIVTGITSVFETQQWTDADAFFSIGIADPASPPNGIAQVNVKGGFLQQPPNWKVMQDGVNILATVAIDEGLSQIRLAFLIPAVTQVWVVIPAFEEELTSLTGQACAGGIIYHDYT